MRTIKKTAWRIYNKITKYERHVIDEFEYELWGRLEFDYYKLLKKLEDDMNNGNDEDRFVSGEYVAFQAVWNNIYDRYFHICKKMGRLEKFYRLKNSRNEDNKNTKKD